MNANQSTSNILTGTDVKNYRKENSWLTLRFGRYLDSCLGKWAYELDWYGHDGTVTALAYT